jgi:DinB superfamily
MEPPAPVPDEKDWTWVLDRPCQECGFDAAATPTGDMARRLRAVAAAFAVGLQRPDARERPEPEVWSALEYGCHVRDVCRIFGERIHLMLTEDDPVFANWDQDATAVTERYWAQEPAVVAGELVASAQAVAAVIERVETAQWSRPGRRSNGSTFTVDSLVRYQLHDLVHHLHDIGSSLPDSDG